MCCANYFLKNRRRRDIIAVKVMRIWRRPLIHSLQPTVLCDIMMTMKTKHIVVIGGGAAGMMAAVSAALGGGRVLLLEKNSRLGTKVKITGGGRCNVTNTADAAEMIQKTICNPRFLYSAFYGLDSVALVEMLAGMGVETKTEDGGRVFPKSDKAADVVDAFARRLEQLQVDVRLNCAVAEIARDTAGFAVKIKGGETILADAVIVATGGLCAPHTGSDGDGYAFAKGLGHSVTKLFPSLVPVNTAANTELVGLGLDDVGLTARLNGAITYNGRGGLMFTHFGLSGPVILTATAVLAEKLHMQPEFALDFAPNLAENELDKHLLSIFANNSAKSVANALSTENFLPQRLAVFLATAAGLGVKQNTGNVSKIQRGALCAAIKDYRVKISGAAGFGSSVITRGGVSVKGIDPATMQSKLVPQLFFAGEVLDVDALTGGYNLHIAFATGWLAGQSATADKIDGKIDDKINAKATEDKYG